MVVVLHMWKLFGMISGTCSIRVRVSHTFAFMPSATFDDAYDDHKEKGVRSSAPLGSVLPRPGPMFSENVRRRLPRQSLHLHLIFNAPPSLM